jgi:PQQ-dependent catabolism-associated CXXCW motif protein
MNPRGAAALLFALALATCAADAADDVPQPPGYRTHDYRAPVPKSLDGARTVSTAQAADLWRQGAAVFVDVLPQAPRPRGLPAGTIWRDQPRFNVPGSVFLPDTGYGELAPAMAEYFADGLARATGGDRSRPLLFYCLADCWMSWNAAKRALALGYPNVIWYPDGTDAWQAAGLPLAQAKPEPRSE